MIIYTSTFITASGRLTKRKEEEGEEQRRKRHEVQDYVGLHRSVPLERQLLPRGVMEGKDHGCIAKELVADSAMTYIHLLELTPKTPTSMSQDLFYSTP